MPPSDEMPAAPRDPGPTLDLFAESIVESGAEPGVESVDSVGKQRARRIDRSRFHAVATQRRPAAVWLGLYLPTLPLEALPQESREVSAGDPLRAVFEEQQGVRRVLMASTAAHAAGVTAGQSVNAALSLCPTLSLEERDRESESRLLRRLAIWADRFTPYVVIEASNLLLLEVAGSLHLFGGIERLCEEIRRSLNAWQITAVMAVAPTPLACVWGARSGQLQTALPDLSSLSSCLSRVPLMYIGWPESIVRKLRGMGVTTVGDCLRLPRQEFARRFGIGRLNDLDRALGRLPDPREHFHQPEAFSGDIEFDTEQDDRHCLLEACRRLLVDLERFLRSRQLEVQRIRVSFFHLRDDATHLVFGGAQAGLDVDHWFDLLELRFENITLPSPVLAIRLRSGRSEAGTPGTAGLLETAGGQQGSGLSVDRLVERLSARIGEDAVHGITTVAEHRPQHAWRRVPPLAGVPHCAAVPTPSMYHPELLQDFQRTDRLLLRRPLWMLDEPELLPVCDGYPLYRGSRLVLEGPERLESGWWDDDGIARDYFVARSQDGLCLWVFRDHRNSDGEDGSGWYLHGMFG